MPREKNPDSDADPSAFKGCMALFLVAVLIVLGAWKAIELIMLAWRHLHG